MRTRAGRAADEARPEGAGALAGGLRRVVFRVVICGFCQTFQASQQKAAAGYERLEKDISERRGDLLVSRPGGCYITFVRFVRRPALPQVN